MKKSYDLIIVGAGPIGIECAIEARKQNLNTLILEKGCLLNSVFHFPPGMKFFSTPELIELGGIPLVTQGDKPTREEYLTYCLRIVDRLNLPVRFDAHVNGIGKSGSIFSITLSTKSPESIHAKSVVIATGYYDNPNMLQVPGEKQPHVSHYYTEGHAYYKKRVCVIGGQNSAAEAALDLYRHGAAVTLVHRHRELGKGIKYWVRPDVENRIKKGEITALFQTKVKSIWKKSVTVANGKRKARKLPADAVFAMTGYHPDVRLLNRAGIQVDKKTLKPLYNTETMETNVPGLYVAGSICAGLEANNLFIENGRIHAQRLVRHVCTYKGNI